MDLIGDRSIDNLSKRGTISASSIRAFPLVDQTKPRDRLFL